MIQDWSAYRGNPMPTFGQIGEVSPDLLKTHSRLAAPRPSEPKPDAKTGELIAVAVAVATRCDGYIAVHTQAAREAGAIAGSVPARLTVLQGAASRSSVNTAAAGVLRINASALIHAEVMTADQAFPVSILHSPSRYR
jgi:AhpD family alkylhydroperoxidase